MIIHTLLIGSHVVVQTKGISGITIIYHFLESHILKVRGMPLQGDPTMGKYLPLLRINRSSIQTMEDKIKLLKKILLTFVSHQPHVNIFLVE